MYSKINSHPRLTGRTPSEFNTADLTTAPAFSYTDSHNPSLSLGHPRTCTVRRGTTFSPLCSEKQFPSVTPEASPLSRLRPQHSVLGASEARSSFAIVKLNLVAILATTSTAKGCSSQRRSTDVDSQSLTVPFPATHCCRSRTTAKAQRSHKDMDSTAPEALGTSVSVYSECVSTAHQHSQSHSREGKQTREGPGRLCFCL